MMIPKERERIEGLILNTVCRMIKATLQQQRKWLTVSKCIGLAQLQVKSVSKCGERFVWKINPLISSRDGDCTTRVPACVLRVTTTGNGNDSYL
jgi:hypothetical protein